MKKLIFSLLIAFFLNANYALADDMCPTLKVEKQLALQKHDQWARTIIIKSKHDGVYTPGEMLIKTDLQEINNKYNYLLSVHGCYND